MSSWEEARLITDAELLEEAIKKGHIKESKMNQPIQEEDATSDLQDDLTSISLADVDALVEAQQSYGDSWKRRGGVGAFMMLARKWDRLEKQVEENNHDIFKAIEEDTRSEGVIDDIRDLRRYLLLVEMEMLERGCIEPE